MIKTEIFSTLDNQINASDTSTCTNPHILKAKKVLIESGMKMREANAEFWKNEIQRIDDRLVKLAEFSKPDAVNDNVKELKPKTLYINDKECELTVDMIFDNRSTCTRFGLSYCGNPGCYAISRPGASHCQYHF